MGDLKKIGDRLERYQKLDLVMDIVCVKNNNHLEFSVGKDRFGYTLRCDDCDDVSRLPMMFLNDDMDILIRKQERVQNRLMETK